MIYMYLHLLKKLQPRRSWTSTSKGRSTLQIENTLIPPNSTEQLAAKSSPASSPAPKPLRDSIAHASTVQPAHVPALQPRTASNRSPAKSRSKLPPEPTTRRGNTRKSAAIETPNHAEFPPPDTNQLATGVSNVPILDDHIQARTAADNLMDSPDDGPHVNSHVRAVCGP
jgi:hypothetical protein